MGDSENKKVYCEICGKEIPPERLEILPNTTTCVHCSNIKPYSSEDLLGLYINEEELPDGINLEDFDEPGTDQSVTPIDLG